MMPVYVSTVLLAKVCGISRSLVHSFYRSKGLVERRGNTRIVRTEDVRRVEPDVWHALQRHWAQEALGVVASDSEDDGDAN